MLTTVYRRLAPRKIQRRLKRRARVLIGGVRGEVGRTLDIFRADWNIDFVLNDKDVHPGEK